MEEKDKKRKKWRDVQNIHSILLLSLTFVPLMIYANDIKGSFTISDFFSSDSDHDVFHILASKLKLYMNEDEKSATSFKIDGRFRKAIENEDIHEDIPEFIVSEMWLGYRFPDQKWNIVAGRQYIDELYNTSVDGLSSRVRRSSLSICVR